MLSNTELRLLSSMINDSATQVAGYFQIPTPIVARVLNEFRSVVGELSASSSSQYFAAELSLTPIDGTSLDLASTLECLSAGCECGKVDMELNFAVHPDLRRADLVGLCRYSRDHKSVFLRAEGSAFSVIVNGVPDAYVNVLAPGANEPRLGRFSRSGREYGLLLTDHRDNALPCEMDTYWGDRARRILIAGKTEKALQNSLQRWLRYNVNDGRVKSEVRDISPERTDIEIVGAMGTSPYVYVIEVKWLGRNASNTCHGVERIDEGSRQVKVYLNRDGSTVTEGILVCYDGRTLVEHNKPHDVSPADVHPKSRHYILYLPSEAASDQGI